MSEARQAAEKHSAALCVDLVAATDARDAAMGARDAAYAIISRLRVLLEGYQYVGSRRISASLECVGCGAMLDMRDALAGKTGVCEPGCRIAAALKDAKEMVP